MYFNNLQTLRGFSENFHLKYFIYNYVFFVKLLSSSGSPLKPFQLIIHERTFKWINFNLIRISTPKFPGNLSLNQEFVYKTKSETRWRWFQANYFRTSKPSVKTSNLRFPPNVIFTFRCFVWVSDSVSIHGEERNCSRIWDNPSRWPTKYTQSHKAFCFMIKSNVIFMNQS